MCEMFTRVHPVHLGQLLQVQQRHTQILVLGLGVLHLQLGQLDQTKWWLIL